MSKYLENLYAGEEHKEERAKKQHQLKVCRTYILGNWEKIEALKMYAAELHGCSAEGHVSHLLSARMSSRPMGWSREGADKMSRLRAYRANGGSFLELAKYQKVDVDEKKLEEIRFSCVDMLRSEKKAKTELEKYYDRYQARIGGQSALKQASIRMSLRIV